MGLTFWAWVLQVCRVLVWTLVGIWVLETLFILGYCAWVVLTRGCRGS